MGARVRKQRGVLAALVVLLTTLGMGWIAASLARADEPADRAVSSVRLAVEPGAEVTVLVRAGRVDVSAIGVARDGGRIGDRIGVRVDPTGALVVARVIAINVVEVRP